MSDLKKYRDKLRKYINTILEFGRNKQIPLTRAQVDPVKDAIKEAFRTEDYSKINKLFSPLVDNLIASFDQDTQGKCQIIIKLYELKVKMMEALLNVAMLQVMHEQQQQDDSDDDDDGGGNETAETIKNQDSGYESASYTGGKKNRNSSKKRSTRRKVTKRRNKSRSKSRTRKTRH